MRQLLPISGFALLALLLRHADACLICRGNSHAAFLPQQSRGTPQMAPFLSLGERRQSTIGPAFFAQLEDSEKEDNMGDKESSRLPKIDPEEEKATDGTSTAMIGTLKFYKNFISPLLPPACRFVPTCSRYGVLAIEEFGAVKGVILIAWRLLRCSPIGGKGYDPPKWPPVEFTYSSY